MNAVKVRRRILDEHATLRHKMAAARTAPNVATLRRALVDLADALHAHSLSEEEVMRELFPDLDGWGHRPLRFDEHVTEHRLMCDALVLASTLEEDAIVTATRLILDRIHDHMDREERVLLADDVLSRVTRPHPRGVRIRASRHP